MPRIVDTGAEDSNPSLLDNLEWGQTVAHSKIGASLMEAPPVRVLHGPPGSNSARGGRVNSLTVNERSG